MKRLLLIGIPIIVLALIVVNMKQHTNSHVAAVTTQAAGLPTAPGGYNWQSSFDDEFNADSLDKSKWNTCYDWYSQAYNGCTNSGNNEQEWYSPSQVQVHDGSAFLTAIKSSTMGETSYNPKLSDPAVSFPYKSGMISTGKTLRNSTNPKWTGGYGYYEIRAKLPSGQGMWPAFWLLPANDKWPPEIDTMELLGNKPNTILMTYFWPTGNYPPPYDSTKYTSSTTNYTEGWHTFAVNWQPGTISWYIDGVVRKTVHSPNVPNDSTRMQIIADLAVGGKLPGNADETTHFPQSMQIDYIRAYALKK